MSEEKSSTESKGNKCPLQLRHLPLAIGVLMFAYACSKYGELVDIPTWLCWLIFQIQWVAFIPAAVFTTEKFYDLTGSLTYLLCIYQSYITHHVANPRKNIVASFVVIWAVRLGSYLFSRIMNDGKDKRFDKIKLSWFRFFAAWTIQGAWVFLTLVPSLLIILDTSEVPFTWIDIFGIFLWSLGFSIEVIADAQKSAFRAQPKNKGKFITTGLWSLSRHPNYCGEFTLWTGIFVISTSILQGYQWTAIISPLFVYVLLTRISGVPLLEKDADKKWGNDPEYIRYKKNTPVFFLQPPKLSNKEN